MAVKVTMAHLKRLSATKRGYEMRPAKCKACPHSVPAICVPRGKEGHAEMYAYCDYVEFTVQGDGYITSLIHDSTSVTLECIEFRSARSCAVQLR
jgi:hypothetical protein